MGNWKGTKGEWYIQNSPSRFQEESEQLDFFIKSDTNNVVHYGTDIMCDDYGEHNGYTWEQRMEDAKLIVDAGNTIQKCDLLPSELLNQRDELLEQNVILRKFITSTFGMEAWIADNKIKKSFMMDRYNVLKETKDS